MKNCLLRSKSFGNINNHSLENIISKEDFQDLWHASVDKIQNVCNSELRYNSIIISDISLNKKMECIK